MDELSPIRPGDVPELARLHRAAFPEFFLSRLGEPFLRQFYRGFVCDDTAVTVVRRANNGTPLGTVVGTTEPAGFYRRLIRRRLVPIALASARAVLRDPRTVGRLVRGVRYRGGVGERNATPGDALLASICVSPDGQRAGSGARLLAAWEAEVARRGSSSAYLTTDAENNDGVNAFYARAGWVCDRAVITREGRRMNLYTKELSGASEGYDNRRD